MKKYILATITLLALASPLTAGTVAIPSNEHSKLVVPNPYSGGDLWLDSLAVVNDNGDLGASLQGSYFFSKFVGVGVDATYIDEGLEAGGNLLFRVPLDLGVAPYVSAGYGYAFKDTVDTGYVNVGAGIRVALDNDYDLQAGVRYHFIDSKDDSVEFTLGIGKRF